MRANITPFNTKEGQLWGEIRQAFKGPKLMEQLHFSMRRKHYSPRTEQSYRYWIRQYIFFDKKQHPSTLNGTHITAFLNHLATKRSVSASTQSQALNALTARDLYHDLASLICHSDGFSILTSASGPRLCLRPPPPFDRSQRRGRILPTG